MSDELKSCPFCGSEATAESYVIEADVRCNGCRAKITRTHPPDNDYGLPEAIAAWNTRAEAALQQQGEAVAVYQLYNDDERVWRDTDKPTFDWWQGKSLKSRVLYTHPPKPVVSDEMVERGLEAFCGATGQDLPVSELQRGLARPCVKAAIEAALGGE